MAARAFYRELAAGVPLTDWLPLALTAEPTCSWADPGGCYEATIPARFDADMALRLAKSEVKVEGYLYPWMGVVDTAIDGTVHAYGTQSYLDDTMREACICVADVASWQPRQRTTMDTSVRILQNGSGIHFTYKAGETHADGSYAGCLVTFPKTNRIDLQFDFTRYSANHVIEVQTGVALDPPVNNESYTWTTRTVSIAGAHATVAATGTDMEAVHISIKQNGAFTPVAEVVDTISNILLRATENAAGTACVESTPIAVVNDSLDRLPDYVIPSDCRDFIASDTSDMGQVRFEATSKESEKHATAAEWNDYRWGVAARMVAGEMTPVVVFEPHSTTPDLVAIVSPGVIVTPAAVPNSQRALVARTTYADAQGRATYVDVTDSDITHPLVQQGRQRMLSMSVDTSAEATATAGGTRKLEAVNAPGSAATVEISTAIEDASGCRVEPYALCEAWGKVLRVEGAESSSVVGRVALVEIVGTTVAKLTLAGLPISPRKAIDRLING